MLSGCGVAGKEISKEEGDKSLMPSSTSVAGALCAEDCVDIVVRVFPMTTSSGLVGWEELGQLQGEHAEAVCLFVAVWNFMSR